MLGSPSNPAIIKVPFSYYAALMRPQYKRGKGTTGVASILVPLVFRCYNIFCKQKGPVISESSPEAC